MISMETGDHSIFHEAYANCVSCKSSLLISDEMMTVVTEKSTWRQNLENIKDLVEAFDYRILVTIRDPLDASFSYFAERYDYFKRHSVRFDQHLLDGEDMRIYRYSQFLGLVFGLFGRKRVFIATFDRIIQAQYSQLEEFLGKEVPKPVTLGQNNSKPRKMGRIVLNQQGSIYSFISEPVARLLRGSSFFRPARGLGLCIRPFSELFGGVGICLSSQMSRD